MAAQSIQVFDVLDGKRVAFEATAGREGCAESAELDFLHFASVQIGAAYVIVSDAATRLTKLGACADQGQRRRDGNREFRVAN